MLRSLFCAAVIFVLVLSLCLLPQTAAARRCPVKEPETLLSLYQNSDAIYIAAFDRITEGEVVETDDDYSVKEIKKNFTISSTLKGQGRKFFALEDREYIYKAVEPEPEEAAEEQPEAEAEQEPETVEETGEYSEEDESTELKSGDTVLLFVKNGDEDEGPELTDFRDGIKPLSMEKIGVYEARIRELNAIFNAKKVSEARIVDWLIRCAEDPATRWEGTYELLQSVRNQHESERAAELRRERMARGEPVEELPTEEEAAEGEKPEVETRKNVDTNNFAKLLAHDHKQTLANILLNSRDPAAVDRIKTVRGDSELIELVAYWGDSRLVGFLLDKLRVGSEDASFNAELMGKVAEILDDKEAEAIAEKYSENAYEEDDEIVEEEAADEESVEAETPEAEKSDKETVEGEAVPPAEDESKPASEEQNLDTEKSDAKKQTYKELRTELMQKFLVQCDKVIAQREKEKETNSVR